MISRLARREVSFSSSSTLGPADRVADASDMVNGDQVRQNQYEPTCVITPADRAVEDAGA